MTRSRRGIAAAATVVLSYPAAIGVQFIAGSGAETVIHFMTGTGFVLLATSVFDFGLPRWINVVGAVAAAAFGGIFLLQGVCDVTGSESLRYVAFDLLGHHLERLLPELVYFWFVALLLLASWGKSRILGWLVMLVVVGLEVATLASLLFGVPMPTVKVQILLPFVWLLFESAESYPSTAVSRSGSRHGYRHRHHRPQADPMRSDSSSTRASQPH